MAPYHVWSEVAHGMREFATGLKMGECGEGREDLLELGRESVGFPYRTNFETCGYEGIRKVVHVGFDASDVSYEVGHEKNFSSVLRKDFLKPF